jgi:hypothetical protein
VAEAEYCQLDPRFGFMRMRLVITALWAAFASQLYVPAADFAPTTLSLSISNGVKTITWPRPLVPALESNRLETGEFVTNLQEVPSGNVLLSPAGYAYVTSNGLPSQFFSLQLRGMSSNALLSANLLNRLAYGLTPDDLEHVANIGPEANIDEQLAPESLSNPLVFRSLRPAPGAATLGRGNQRDREQPRGHGRTRPPQRRHLESSVRLHVGNLGRAGRRPRN